MNVVAADPAGGVRPLNPSQCIEWDRMVDTFSGSNVFHRCGWASALQTAYGFRACYLVEGRLDAPLCILPLMEVRSWATGTRGISLPFTDHCEPLHRDAGAPARLFDAAVRLARQRRWRYLELRGGPPIQENATAVSYYGHRLSLDRDLAAIHADVHDSTRRSIRKAVHAGVTVTISRDMEAMRHFYRLQCKTRRRLGVPPQPWSFFEALQRFTVTNEGIVVLAHHQGVPIAGAVFLHHGDTAIFKYGASDSRFQHLRATNLVMWRAIERLQKKGAKVLDFGRTSIDHAGLRRFKLSWGSIERRIEYFRYCLRTSAFIRVKDRATGCPTHLLRLMPAPVARWCGALLYKHTA